MRNRLMLVVAIAAVLAAALPTAALANGNKATGGVGYITGGGADAHASFVAMEGPKGPKGQVNVRNHDGLDFRGTVDCYSQDGNIARFSGTITDFSGDNDNGQGTTSYIMVVEDNGEGANAAPDRITLNRNEAADSCESNAFNANQPVDEGNLQVH